MWSLVARGYRGRMVIREDIRRISGWASVERERRVRVVWIHWLASDNFRF